MAQTFPPLDELVTALKSLPGIGTRSAQRIAIHLLKAPAEEVRALAEVITDVRGRVRFCCCCGQFSVEDECGICRDPGRDRKTVCVVEDPKDVIAFEATGTYRGLYHVLMGRLSPLDGMGPEDLRIEELLSRVRSGNPGEVILATGADVEGEATAVYLTQLLQPFPVAVSRIAHGIPVGLGLEFTDGITLSRALEGRRKYEL